MVEWSRCDLEVAPNAALEFVWLFLCIDCPNSAKSRSGRAIVCLETESYDFTSPDDTTLDLVHKPGSAEGVYCHCRVVTPTFWIVCTRVIEGGASESTRPRPDPRVGVQLAPHPTLRIRPQARLRRRGLLSLQSSPPNVLDCLQ